MVKKNKKFLVLANLARGVGQVCVEKKNFSHEGFQHGMCIGRVWVEKKKGGF